MRELMLYIAMFLLLSVAIFLLGLNGLGIMNELQKQNVVMGAQAANIYQIDQRLDLMEGTIELHNGKAYLVGAQACVIGAETLSDPGLTDKIIMACRQQAKRTQ